MKPVLVGYCANCRSKLVLTPKRISQVRIWQGRYVEHGADFFCDYVCVDQFLAGAREEVENLYTVYGGEA